MYYRWSVCTTDGTFVPRMVRSYYGCAGTVPFQLGAGGAEGSWNAPTIKQKKNKHLPVEEPTFHIQYPFIVNHTLIEKDAEVVLKWVPILTKPCAPDKKRPQTAFDQLHQREAKKKQRLSIDPDKHRYRKPETSPPLIVPGLPAINGAPCN